MSKIFGFSNDGNRMGFRAGPIILWFQYRSYHSNKPWYCIGIFLHGVYLKNVGTPSSNGTGLFSKSFSK